MKCEINLSQDEGSSKSSQHSVKKNTPPETKQIKSPLSYLDKRHMNIQFEFATKIEPKLTIGTQTSEYIEQKFDKKWIESLRKSPEKPTFIENKSSSYYATQAQQVIVADCSMDTMNYTSDDNNEELQKKKWKFLTF